MTFKKGLPRTLGLLQGSLSNSQGEGQSPAPPFLLPTHHSDTEASFLSSPIKDCQDPEKDKKFQGVSGRRKGNFRTCREGDGVTQKENLRKVIKEWGGNPNWWTEIG